MMQMVGPDGQPYDMTGMVGMDGNEIDYGLGQIVDDMAAASLNGMQQQPLEAQNVEAIDQSAQ